jgi:DNA-binding transcriptional MerR regulator
MDGPLNLEQLASISGEKPRTIRSWIRNGLLPPARGGGRGSYYDEEHVDRLLFVVKLREKAGARLPSSVVRDVLHQLLRGPDPDVVRRVAHGEESLEIADLFGAPSSSVEVLANPARMSMSMDLVPRAFDDADEDSEFSALSMASPPRSEPRWTTIQLREDLELRLASDDPERVAWLARIARQLRQLLEQEGEP